MKLTVAVTACILALLVGAAFGFQYARVSERAGITFLASQSNAEFMRSQAALLASDDPLSVEGALWRQIAATEADARSASPRFTDTIRAKDAVLAYARLSQLAATQPSEERARRFLAQAATACPPTGWTDCSPSRILSIARELTQSTKQ